ncbi:MAG TPA: hypothetical protein VFG09_00280 [Thermodesulfovibrionales bacterium]|nr:hypothetical protein [Thermodesulfovibrionales bacterium]
MATLDVIKKFIESSWIIEKAARGILERLPLRFRYGISYGPTFRYWLGFLKECETWDRARLEAYQVEELRHFLIHTGKNVPYYRKIFAEYGFRPEKLHSPTDLQSLPYTDKEIVRDNIGAFVAEDVPVRSLFKKTTSGSTGIPLTIYSDKEAEEKHWATVAYSWSKTGYSPKSRIVMFWNSRQRMKRYGNTLLLSRYFFDDEPLQQEFASLMRAFGPEVVYGIPSALYAFSTFMKERNIAPFENIKACIVESDTLYPWQREVIEEMFHTRTFTTYGLVEKVLHGFQCMETQTYHIYPQYGVLEGLSMGDNLFEIVGTGLINYALPLIRYKTADLGTLRTAGKCQGCKSDYPCLDLAMGRVRYLLVGKSGALYSPLTVGVDSDVFDHVRIFQFYQDTPGKVLLRLVRKDSFSDSDLRKIRKVVVTDIGLEGRESDLEVEMVFVDHIEKMPSGKFAMVHQMLDVRAFAGHP